MLCKTGSLERGGGGGTGRRESRKTEEEGAMWRHCGAAFDTGTVTERLKCQVRFPSRGADEERGSVATSRSDI